MSMNVTFLIELDKTLKLTIDRNSTIEELLLEFLKQTNSRIDLSRTKIDFLYRNIFLNDPSFLYIKSSKLLKKNNIIKVLDKQNLILGKGNTNMFLGRDKKDPDKFLINNDGPMWKVLEHGLNIFGKCSNISCRAYQKDVSVRIGMADYDFEKNQWELKCPCANCHALIRPEIFGFIGCQYQIEGIKYYENTENLEKFKTVWNSVENEKIVCYDPSQNAHVKYIKLLLHTKKL